MTKPLLAIVLLAAAVSELTAIRAQSTPAVITSPAPLCFGFNEPLTAWTGTSFLVFSNGGVLIQFVAPASATADQIEIYEGQPVTLLGAVASVNPGTGAPNPIPLATFSTPSTHGFGWRPHVLSAPVPFVSGAAYMLHLVPSPANYAPFIGYEPAGATPLPYVLTGSAILMSGVPAGPIALKLRFRGAGCGPGPPAAAAVFYGMPCPAIGGFLYVQAPPVLGTTGYGIVLPGVTPSTTSRHILWSIGFHPTGIPLTPLNPCVLYLDPASFAQLSALGLEPLVSLTPQFPSQSQWFINIPSLPALAGTVITMQDVRLDPIGVASGFGPKILLSTPLVLMLGY